MKPQSSQTTQSTSPTSSKRPRLDDATRCQHRTPSGRRCWMPIRHAGERLCSEHTNRYKKQDAFSLEKALLFDYQGFQTAQGINFALRNLYGLLANNYISPRRASVLAYISSLLLRTLPQIDADRAVGIADPNVEPESASDTDPGMNADIAAETTNSESTSGTEPVQQSSRPVASESTEAWPDSVPEPDPTKKPS